MRRVLAPTNAASNERADLWLASVRRDQERKRQELNALRVEYHAGQAKRLRLTMTDLIAHHERAAEKLLEGMSV